MVGENDNESSDMIEFFMKGETRNLTLQQFCNIFNFTNLRSRVPSGVHSAMIGHSWTRIANSTSFFFFPSDEGLRNSVASYLLF